jgi:hypothetical protein
VLCRNLTVDDEWESDPVSCLLRATKALRLRFHAVEHVGHLLMHQIDCLQWSNHDSELDDLSCVIARNDVYAIDVFAINGGFKL